MSKVSRIAVAVLCFALLSPALVQAQQAEPTVYTFVAEWGVNRADWDTWWASFEKNSKPVLERHSANGNVVAWAAYATLVHDDSGITHGVYWSSTSYAALNRVLDDLRKAAPTSAGVTKHRDYLVRSIMHSAKASAPTTGYLYVSAFQVQPGKGAEWRGLWEKYNKASMDANIANGNLLAYSVEVEEVHTLDPAIRWVVSVSPNAEADDRANAADEAANQKRSAEERRAIGAAFADVLVPGSHRDFYAKILAYWHK